MIGMEISLKITFRREKYNLMLAVNLKMSNLIVIFIKRYEGVWHQNILFSRILHCLFISRS